MLARFPRSLAATSVFLSVALVALAPHGAASAAGSTTTPLTSATASYGEAVSAPPCGTYWCAAPANRKVLGRYMDNPVAAAQADPWLWLVNADQSINAIAMDTGRIMNRLHAADLGLSSPSALAIDNGGLLWVAGDGAVVAYSTSSRAVVHRAAGTAFHLNGSVSSMVDDGSKLWVLSGGGSWLTGINKSNGSLAKAIHLTSPAIAGAQSLLAFGGNLYVAGANAITVVSASSGRVTATWDDPALQLSGVSAIALRGSWQGPTIWVANTSGNSLSEIEVSDGSLRRSVAGVPSPGQMVASWNGLLVASGDGAITMVTEGQSTPAKTLSACPGSPGDVVLATGGVVGASFIRSAAGCAVEVNLTTGDRMGAVLNSSFATGSTNAMLADASFLYRASGGNHLEVFDGQQLRQSLQVDGFAAMASAGGTGAIWVATQADRNLVADGGGFRSSSSGALNLQLFGIYGGPWEVLNVPAPEHQGGAVTSLAFDGTQFWVTEAVGSPGQEAGLVLQVNRDGSIANEIADPLLARPSALATDGSRVWVLTGAGKLLKIDPAEGSLTEVHLPFTPSAAASMQLAGTQLWVSEGLGGGLAEVNVASGQVEQALTDHPATTMAVGNGLLWLAHGSSVEAIDPVKGDPLTWFTDDANLPASVPANPWITPGPAVAAAGAGLWAFGATPVRYRISGDPSAPTALQVNPQANSGSVTEGIAWSPPDYDGGAPITSYVVEVDGTTVCTVPAWGQLGCFAQGLDLGTSHTATVRATNADGRSAEAVLPFSTPSRPSQPTNLVVTPGHGSLKVSWSPGAGGAWVKQYVATATPGGQSCVGTGYYYGSTQSCTITGLSMKQRYSVSVVAKGDFGDSPAAVSDPVDLRSAPDAVGHIVTTALPTGEVNVSWAGPAYDGGSPIYAYTATAFDFSQSGAQGASCVAWYGATSCTISGLEVGRQWAVSVSAVNAFGSSDYDTYAYAWPFTKPGTPSHVRAVPRDGALELSWGGAPANGAYITAYTVTVDGQPGCTTTGATTCTIAGLTNGQQYRVEVRATNAAGDGPASVDYLTPATVPATPGGFTVTPGDGSATGTWQWPSSNGGAHIDYFTLSYRLAGSTDPWSFGCEAGRWAGYWDRCTISGLTNGTAYELSVTATNAAGSSAGSDPIAVTPRTTPGAPRLMVMGNATESPMLMVTPPLSDGGAALDGGELSIVDNATKDQIGYALDAKHLSNQGLMGLARGHSYTVKMRVHNAAGYSDWSSEVNVSTLGTPAKPTGVDAVPGDGLAKVSWVAPADEGSSAVTGYTATASPGGASCTVDAPSTTCTITGLSNGTAYTVTVVASNSRGSSRDSDPSASFTPRGVPGAPTDVKVVAGNASVDVSWIAPISDGASAITAYTVTASPGGATCVAKGATSCTVSGLTNGTAYTVSVTATNAVGTSTASKSSASFTPSTKPGAPTTVKLTAANASLGVAWTAPADNGGSAVTSYTATASPGGASCATTSGTTCTITGLTNGTAYTVTVTATNANGTGPASTPSAAATPITTASAPTSVAIAATTTAGQLKVTWVAPASNGGSAITGYTATASPGGKTCTAAATALTCTVTGLTSGTKYTVSVTATNAAGVGAAGTSGTAAPKLGTKPVAPSAPSGLTLQASNGSLVVSWSAPANDGGSAITHYTATASPGGATCRATTATTCTISGLKRGVSYTVGVTATNAAGTSPVARSTASTAYAKAAKARRSFLAWLLAWF